MPMDWTSLKTEIDRRVQCHCFNVNLTFHRLGVLAWQKNDNKSDKICRTVAESFPGLCRLCPIDTPSDLTDFFGEAGAEREQNSLWPQGCFLLWVSGSSDSDAPQFDAPNLPVTVQTCALASGEDDTDLCWRINTNTQPELQIAALLLLGVSTRIDKYVAKTHKSIEAKRYNASEYTLARGLKAGISGFVDSSPDSDKELFKRIFGPDTTTQSKILRAFPKLTDLPIIGADQLNLRWPEKRCFFKRNSLKITARELVDLLFGMPNGEKVEKWLLQSAEVELDRLCRANVKLPSGCDKLPTTFLVQESMIRIDEFKTAAKKKIAKLEAALEKRMNDSLELNRAPTERILLRLKDVEGLVSECLDQRFQYCWWDAAGALLDDDGEFIAQARNQHNCLVTCRSSLSRIYSEDPPPKHIGSGWGSSEILKNLLENGRAQSRVAFDENDLFTIAKKAHSAAVNVHGQLQRDSMLLLSPGTFQTFTAALRNDDAQALTFDEDEDGLRTHDAAHLFVAPLDSAIGNCCAWEIHAVYDNGGA